MEGCVFAGRANIENMNWDDLRIVQAVYQSGSYAAAATRLRINETTVARRLARFEDDLGVMLFEARDGTRKPTQQCEEIVAIAGKMSDQAGRIAMIGKAQSGPVGTRRIATTDSIATEVLAPGLASLLATFPGLSIEFLASTENVDFSRWEADIAVRFQRPDKGDFVISKLADIDLLLIEPADTTAPSDQFVCAYPEDLDLTPESQHLASIGLKRQARCFTKNLLVQKQLLQSGRCTAILASYMCLDLLDDPRFRISRLPQNRSVWLLVQSHLKHDTATRAVIDWIKACFGGLDGAVARVPEKSQ